METARSEPPKKHCKNRVLSEQDHAFNLVRLKASDVLRVSSEQTINSDVYCDQLDKLKAAIHEMRLELVNRRCASQRFSS